MSMPGYGGDVGSRSPEVAAFGTLADLGRTPPNMRVPLYALPAPLNGYDLSPRCGKEAGRTATDKFPYNHTLEGSPACITRQFGRVGEIVSGCAERRLLQWRLNKKEGTHHCQTLVQRQLLSDGWCERSLSSVTLDLGWSDERSKAVSRLYILSCICYASNPSYLSRCQ